MANKIKPIPSKARELLEAVVNEFGIDVIKDYIKIYDKQQRRRTKKYNTKEEIAYEVYRLMYQEGYSRIRAIEKVAVEKNISENTINNHLNNFNKEAKKNNFYTFGWIVDKIYDYANMNGQFYCNSWYYIDEAIDLLAKTNDLEKEVIETYYWKYKTLPKREKSKYKLDLNSIKIPDDIKCVIPKDYLPQETTLQETTFNQNSNKNFSSNNNIQLDEDDIPF